MSRDKDINQNSSNLIAKKKGFVKKSRAFEYLMFGPDSPLPETWRVFYFIAYRIQDNKSLGQFERISREYIIEKTGIWENHFSRIIKKLIEMNLIEVSDKKNGVASYRLSRAYFGIDTVVFDKKQTKKVPVDNSQSDVDNSCGKDVDNTKLVSENESQHQNGVDQHQIGEGMGITRSLPLEPFINLRARADLGYIFGKKAAGAKTHEKFGLTDEEFKKLSLAWSNETNDSGKDFGVWLEERKKA
jgi:hypothetical protein